MPHKLMVQTSSSIIAASHSGYISYVILTIINHTDSWKEGLSTYMGSGERMQKHKVRKDNSTTEMLKSQQH